jgi:OsmC subfamily peroxiredoxin
MALYGSGGNINRRGTNPTELIAAAQAGSFSLTLANELGEAGFSPRQIDTTATITMENIAASWTMTQIHLDVVATVPKVAQCDFVDAALRAKANCPVSRALNANISMQAKLTDRAADDQLRRASHSFDVFPIVESSLRLKDAMQKEERAIKGLTWVLVVLTVVLVGLTFILVRLGYEAVQASTPHDQSNPSSPPR